MYYEFVKVMLLKIKSHEMEVSSVSTLNCLFDSWCIFFQRYLSSLSVKKPFGYI